MLHAATLDDRSRQRPVVVMSWQSSVRYCGDKPFNALYNMMAILNSVCCCTSNHWKCLSTDVMCWIIGKTMTVQYICCIYTLAQLSTVSDIQTIFAHVQVFVKTAKAGMPYQTLCIDVSVLASSQLWSDDNKLVVPRTLTSTFGSQALSTSCPADWNTLSSELHHPFILVDSFRHSLKTYLYKNYAWFCVATAVPTSASFWVIQLVWQALVCLLHWLLESIWYHLENGVVARQEAFSIWQ